MSPRKSKKPGLVPGTLIPPPDAFFPKTVHVIHYTEKDIEETDVDDFKVLARYKDGPGVTWINADGVGNVELIQELGRIFDLHRLALEDVVSVPQRPKVDDYETHLYLVKRMPRYEGKIETEQISLFLRPNVVITFQEKPGDCLDPVRERLRKGAGQIRREGSDYLMYSILDTIIDHYFPMLELIGEDVEKLEDDVVGNPSPQILGRIHGVKRSLLDLRRSVWPLREAVNSLLRDESPLIRKATRLYLRDCYDHAVHVIDVIETYREIAGGLMDIYLSSLSNKMNEVMKVLTIIATIFIPMTFIAGIYGMNFEKMPELKWAWAYPAVWGVMVIISTIMLVFFARRGWLGRGRAD